VLRGRKRPAAHPPRSTGAVPPSCSRLMRW
jgi:hypothetical protein